MNKTLLNSTPHSNIAGLKKIITAITNFFVLVILFSLFFALPNNCTANNGNISKESATNQQTGINITSVEKHSLGEGINAKKFYAGVVDDKNTKWFLTDAGVISGLPFSVAISKDRVPLENSYNLAFESNDNGSGLWIGTQEGAFLASFPIEANSNITRYDMSNSDILSNNVMSVAVGKNHVRWFVTDKGISALYNDKWLMGRYQIYYPPVIFKNFPVTATATSVDGDSLYAATSGLGISRVYRNDVDAISGASQYAYWGPINLPSDSVYSICIAPGDAQWFGTTRGVARHTGYVTMQNWTVFDTNNGLVNNFVKAVAVDQNGNVWCGTKGGISVYNGESWKSFTTEDGLLSNNILFIVSDNDGSIYLGTDNGLMVYNNGKLDCYQ